MNPLPVHFYQNEDGTVPLLEWLETLRSKSQIKIIERIRLLEEYGKELRRPHADYLQAGIYELRAKDNDLQLRVLYFFHGRKAIILSHGITKNTSAVPSKEIAKALERMKKYERDPEAHTFMESEE